jgi:hypothetical protein
LTLSKQDAANSKIAIPSHRVVDERSVNHLLHNQLEQKSSGGQPGQRGVRMGADRDAAPCRAFLAAASTDVAPSSDNYSRNQYWEAELSSIASGKSASRLRRYGRWRCAGIDITFEGISI